MPGGAVQTFAGNAFEIDLNEDWRFYPDPEEPGFLYFQNQRVDAGLACDSMVTEPHDRDLDDFGLNFIEAYVGGMGKAAAMEGAPEPPKIHSINQLQVETGREWIVSGFSAGRGQWFAWIVVRNFMYFTMRMESLTMLEAQLAFLFNQVRRNVFLAELKATIA